MEVMTENCDEVMNNRTMIIINQLFPTTQSSQQTSPTIEL